MCIDFLYIPPSIDVDRTHVNYRRVGLAPADTTTNIDKIDYLALYKMSADVEMNYIPPEILRWSLPSHCFAVRLTAFAQNDGRGGDDSIGVYIANKLCSRRQIAQ